VNALGEAYIRYLPPPPCKILVINNSDVAEHLKNNRYSITESIDGTQFDILFINEQKLNQNSLILFNHLIKQVNLNAYITIQTLTPSANKQHYLINLAQRFGLHYLQYQHISNYTLLSFQYQRLPKWIIRPLDTQQLDNMLILFKHVFKHTMSRELWQWKYHDKNSHALCIWENDQLIAHYGGMPRNILYFGEPKHAIQIGDVMVNPKQRGVLTKNGPFFRMTATFMELYTGYQNPFLISFGFPNERHIKLAEHLGLYAEVGRMIALSWQPALTSRPRFMSHLQPINKQNFEQLSPHIEYLWQSMSDDLKQSIIGQRNSHYIKQRYLNHPEQAYHLLLVKNRWSRQVYGLLVLQYQGEQCDIIDIIARPQDIPLLILHARRMASLNQCQRLYCQITLAFSHYFKLAEHHIESLSIPIASDTWSHGPHPEELNNHWWLMAGDMDCR